MTLQGLDKAWGWIGCPDDCREEDVAIRAGQDHALMLIEKSACTFTGKIAGGKTCDRHGLLDYLFRRWRKT